MSAIAVREATIDDSARILRFITELAIYEKAEHDVHASVQDIETSLFSSDSVANALIGEKAGEPVGFAVYFFNYSTWQGKPGLYLEDLYVSENSRGCGAGVALLKALANIALNKNCGRFEWSVLDWNEPAIDFYNSIGALPQNEWLKYRLDGDALDIFASS